MHDRIMAAEERHSAPSLHQSSAGPKTELYRYSASSYTTKSNEGTILIAGRIQNSSNVQVITK